MTRTSAAFRAVRLLAAVLPFLAWGCGGGLSITPTSPSGAPLPSAVPITISFRGTLADGGAFDGHILYGNRDQDSRTGFGRYNGGTWEVTVKGGTVTHDVHFSNTTGGRSLIETYRTPFPAIGIVILWPDGDPVLQSLTPHVSPVPGYDPDVQPRLRDFGGLIPGQFDPSFGVFSDESGARTLVTSFVIQ